MLASVADCCQPYSALEIQLDANQWANTASQVVASDSTMAVRLWITFHAVLITRPVISVALYLRQHLAGK